MYTSPHTPITAGLPQEIKVERLGGDLVCTKWTEYSIGKYKQQPPHVVIVTHRIDDHVYQIDAYRKDYY